MLVALWLRTLVLVNLLAVRRLRVGAPYDLDRSFSVPIASKPPVVKRLENRRNATIEART